jgi:hypothetical protein
VTAVVRGKLPPRANVLVRVAPRAENQKRILLWNAYMPDPSLFTPPGTAIQTNKVVVALVDNRRIKGFVYNFSAVREIFSVFPTEAALKIDAKEIRLKDVKAVFFVRDFAGNSVRKDAQSVEQMGRGRKLQIVFCDGETMIGTTEAYHPQKLGFFMFPADAEGNNTRVFVVNGNLKSVKFL